MHQTNHDDDRVQHQVGRHQANGDADCLFEPLQEHRSEQRDQPERHQHALVV
jgi:hypothetical protein